ncbi:(2Fe-2S)-binding protein [Kitasatospora sp. NPDC049258]|uniref:(2Fe-2S)-binding protein n=1 Tax=Kitasatospora sp. NPDC049258 TaxID=3155394 RepID=UPI00343598D3
MTVRSAAPLPAVPDPEAPLAASYHRLADALPALRIHCASTRPGDDPGADRDHGRGEGRGHGWVRAADLAQLPGVLAESVARESREAARRYGAAPRPDVAAGLCLHRYAWPVALAFTLPWFLERRVPRLPVERVAVRHGGSELSLATDEFSCLPDDPRAGLPGARVVPDETALERALLAGLVEHLTPVLAAFRPLVRRGPRTLWGLATDEVVEGLWYLGGLLGEEERAVAELTRLLPGTPRPPFTGGAGFELLERPGAEPLRTRTRVSCCLFYTIRPAEACFGCPRTANI